jgi:hypothetical protein
MKAGRRALRVGDYANARAVESALLALAKSGDGWPSPKEIIKELRAHGALNPRVVWNRGRARMLASDRLLVQAKLDARQRGVERYRLKYVEGRPPKPIRMEEYEKLPDEVRRYYRPVGKEEEQENSRRGFATLGSFLDGLRKIATPTVLNTLTYPDLLAEIERRRRIWAGTFEYDVPLERAEWEARRTDPKWWPPDLLPGRSPDLPSPPRRKIKLPTVAVEPPVHRRGAQHTPTRQQGE